MFQLRVFGIVTPLNTSSSHARCDALKFLIKAAMPLNESVNNLCCVCGASIRGVVWGGIRFETSSFWLDYANYVLVALLLLLLWAMLLEGRIVPHLHFRYSCPSPYALVLWQFLVKRKLKNASFASLLTAAEKATKSSLLSSIRFVWHDVKLEVSKIKRHHSPSPRRWKKSKWSLSLLQQ